MRLIEIVSVNLKLERIERKQSMFNKQDVKYARYNNDLAGYLIWNGFKPLTLEVSLIGKSQDRACFLETPDLQRTIKKYKNSRSYDASYYKPFYTAWKENWYSTHSRKAAVAHFRKKREQQMVGSKNYMVLEVVCCDNHSLEGTCVYRKRIYDMNHRGKNAPDNIVDAFVSGTVNSIKNHCNPLTLASYVYTRAKDIAAKYSPSKFQASLLIIDGDKETIITELLVSVDDSKLDKRPFTMEWIDYSREKVYWNVACEYDSTFFDNQNSYSDNYANTDKFPGEPEETVKRHRTITCPCWDVTGHNRTYKRSGKQVWIDPYKKGKMRDHVNEYQA